MKFVVFERITVKNDSHVNVLGTFSTWEQAKAVVDDKWNSMSEMYGVNEDSVYNSESLKPFYFKGENGEHGSWWIEKQEQK